MQLSGLNSPPYLEERRESIEPGSRSKHAALGMYLPSIVTGERKITESRVIKPQKSYIQNTNKQEWTIAHVTIRHIGLVKQKKLLV